MSSSILAVSFYSVFVSLSILSHICRGENSDVMFMQSWFALICYSAYRTQTNGFSYLFLWCLGVMY